MTRRVARALGTVLLLWSSAAFGDVRADADRLVSHLASGTATGPDGARLFTPGLRISALDAGSRTLDLDDDVTDLSEVTDALRHETLLGALTTLGLDDGFHVRVRRDGRWRSLGGDSPPRPATPREFRPPATTQLTRTTGALAGRRIAISPGHGWLPDDTGGGWHTQRSNWKFTGCGTCRGITEDFYSAETVGDHLLPLLEGMGAEVVLVRELDRSTEPGVIVDDGDTGVTEDGTFRPGDSTGGYGDDYRTAEPGTNASANYDLPVTRAGYRRVSLRWVGGANRGVAGVEVTTPAGVFPFSVDQRNSGAFWLDFGKFWFGPEGASVRLVQGAAGFLVADAVRLGGGVHEPSQKPWWQMGALSYVPWSGAPPDVLARNDVTIRPAFADFTGADAYVSIHGNASGVDGGSTTNGLSTYRFNCLNYPDHSLSSAATDCDAPTGSRDLEDALHTAILGRLRGDWDPNFGNRQQRVANFGELRVLDGIPGVLVEAAFFDNLASPSGSPPPRFPDNRSMQDPRWRDAFATGLAEGLAAYFGHPGRLPGRPEALVARNDPTGTVTLTFAPAADATSHRVQWIVAPTEDRARAWNDGRVIEGNSLVFDDLPAGAVVAFRVVGTNATGEGFPSQAVVVKVRGARVPEGMPPSELLVIAAYDRRDAWVTTAENDFSYAIEHAQAFADIDGLWFDGALDEAVESLAAPLAGYRLVDVFTGKDSTDAVPVSEAMRQRLADFRFGGGRVLLTGEEIGYAMVETSTVPAEIAWFEGFLGAHYVADDAETNDVSGAPGTAFDGLSLHFDDGTHGTYRVLFPDVVSAANDTGRIVLRYPDGTGAAILDDRTFFAGFPLETVYPAADRAALASRIVTALAVPLHPGDTDLDGATDACEAAAGLDPRDASDGPLDLDHDGTTNAAECANGTDPAHDDSGGGDEDPKPCGCQGGGLGTAGILGLSALLRRRRR